MTYSLPYVINDVNMVCNIRHECVIPLWSKRSKLAVFQWFVFVMNICLCAAIHDVCFFRCLLQVLSAFKTYEFGRKLQTVPHFQPNPIRENCVWYDINDC